MNSLPRDGAARQGRAALAVAFTLLALCLVQLGWRMQLPADGWAYPLDIPADGQRYRLGAYVGRGPTTLQAGDVLHSIEGQPVTEIVGNALRLQPNPPANWQPGATVTYQVQRGAETVTATALLQRRSIGQYVQILAQTVWSWLGLFLQVLIGVFIFWRRPDHAAARVFLAWNIILLTNLLSMPLSGQNAAPAELYSLAYWPAYFFNVLVYPFILVPGLAHIFLVFPVVKKPMRRWPRLTLLLIYGLPVALLAPLLFSRLHSPLDVWPAVLIVGPLSIAPAALIVSIGSLVHTLVVERNLVVRAQTRWLLLGLVLSWGIGNGALFFAVESGVVAATPLVLFLLGLLTLVFPVTLAITILRYHLFDIDLIVRRTLVYTLLTLVLGLVYFGSVTVLSSLFFSVTGQQSALVVVVSTLLIATLFSPLRRRIQDGLDRRFFRRKYDAQQVLAGFAQTARDETDLEALTAELLRVVQETMQPERVSVWLRESPHLARTDRSQ